MLAECSFKYSESDYQQVPTARKTIKLLNKDEIKGMRKVCRLAREVLDIAAAALKPGITTDQIDEIVHKACVERDVSGLAAFCCFGY